MKMPFHILRHYVVAVVVFGGIWAGQPLAASAQEMRSAALARELTSLMTAAKLDAIALQDPAAPDRFIAAMLFPEVQLLMVTAGHPSPDYVKWQIEQKQYKDVYALLQQSGLIDTRVFFQDLGADGLPQSGNDTADVMYVRGVQTLFDRAAKNGGGSKDVYAKKLREADAQYSRLLQLAIDALRPPSGQDAVQVR